VDLFQDLVDVHGVRFLPLLMSLLLSLRNVLRLGHCLLPRSFPSCLGWHVELEFLTESETK